MPVGESVLGFGSLGSLQRSSMRTVRGLMPASGIGFVPSLQEQKFLLSRERPVSTRRPTGKGSVSLPAGLGGTRTGGCGPAVVAVVFGADSEDVGPSLPA